MFIAVYCRNQEKVHKTALKPKEFSCRSKFQATFLFHVTNQNRIFFARKPIIMVTWVDSTLLLVPVEQRIVMTYNIQ